MYGLSYGRPGCQGNSWQAGHSGSLVSYFLSRITWDWTARKKLTCWFRGNFHHVRLKSRLEPWLKAGLCVDLDIHGLTSVLCLVFSTWGCNVMSGILDLAGSRAAHPFCSLHGKPQAAPGVAGLLRSLPHKPTDLASSCSLFSLIRASLQTAWCWAGERRDIAGTREIALFTLLTTVLGPWSLLVGCSISNNFHSRNAVNAAQRVVERCLHLYL